MTQSAMSTRGLLSVKPFRLYPQTAVDWRPRHKCPMIASLSSRLSHVLTLSKTNSFFISAKRIYLEIICMMFSCCANGRRYPALNNLFWRASRTHPLPPQAGPTALAVEQMQTIAGASSTAFPHQYQLPEGIHGFPGKIHCLVYIYITLSNYIGHCIYDGAACFNECDLTTLSAKSKTSSKYLRSNSLGKGYDILHAAVMVCNFSSGEQRFLSFSDNSSKNPSSHRSGRDLQLGGPREPAQESVGDQYDVSSSSLQRHPR